MSSGFLGATLPDPIARNNIGENDIHFSVVAYYYELKQIFQPEFDKLKNNYLNRVWHDYAVKLLQTAEFLGINTRPPNFEAAPLPPSAHEVSIDSNYKVSITQVVVCQQPPDPNPALLAIKLRPGTGQQFGNMEEWDIVSIAPSAPFTTPITSGQSPFVVTEDMVISYLKNLQPTARITLLNKIFN